MRLWRDRADDGPPVSRRNRVGGRRQRSRSRLCIRNAERNAIGNIVVAHPDEVPADVDFATIWSNPPIRIGKDSLHELLLSWLARLQPAGHAALVVQKHLGADSLQRWLIERGYVCVRAGSKAGFRILEIRHGADERE